MAHHWRVDWSFALTAKAECPARTASQPHARRNDTPDGIRHALTSSAGQPSLFVQYS